MDNIKRLQERIDNARQGEDVSAFQTALKRLEAARAGVRVLPPAAYKVVRDERGHELPLHVFRARLLLLAYERRLTAATHCARCSDAFSQLDEREEIINLDGEQVIVHVECVFEGDTITNPAMEQMRTALILDLSVAIVAETY